MAAFGSRGSRRAAAPGRWRERWGVARAGLAGFLLATGCASNSGTEGGSGEDRLVCPKCSVAGGETSDFGQTAVPTACQASESRVPIDEASARALGFGDGLDLYTRSFTAPLAWTADELNGGAQPAQGYSAATSITMQTSIASITHLVPGLSGCADHLQVGLHVSLSTTDGAISVAGDIYADARRAASSDAFGRLDLSHAQGSLQLYPPAWPNLVGNLALLLHFEPQTVRGAAYLEMTQPGSEESDTGARYRPLDARFPIDDCDYRERVVTVSDPTGVPGGKSALDFNAELNAILQADQSAQWKNSGQTLVHASLGVPTSLCQSIDNVRLRYVAVPLDLVSSDGRINLHGVADGSASFDATGAPDEVWFQRHGTVDAQALAESVGISGVDLGDYPHAFWSAEVHPFATQASAVGGTITISGVQANGALADENGNTVGPLETLSWP